MYVFVKIWMRSIFEKEGYAILTGELKMEVLATKLMQSIEDTDS